MNKINECRICGNKQLISLLNLGSMASTGLFLSGSELNSVDKEMLELTKCHSNNDQNCGLVQLAHNFDLHTLYGDTYGYQSSLNRSMVKHLEEISQKVKQHVPLTPNSVVLDIGSNDGTLLNYFADQELQCVGFDPVGEKFRNKYHPKVQLISDFFSAKTFKEKFQSKKVMVITSIAMFYDLESPIQFVKDVYELLDEAGIWIFEQSYLPRMLEQNSYDTICHEHLEYYSLTQIKWMTDLVGLKIVDFEFNEINGGSIQVIAAKKNNRFKAEITQKIENVLEQEQKLADLTIYEEFKLRIEKNKKNLLETLITIKNLGKTTLGYGASTKGNVLLQYCGIDRSLIPYIAEVNEDKYGKYTPGSCIPIISEIEARKMNVDYFLVLPWHFRENIIAKEKDFITNGGKLIFPLPTVEIVG